MMNPTLVRVAIHPSQFPENVARDLRESLRSRQVNHKFLYDGWRQTRKWLALHQAYSPSRTEADCLGAYGASFAAAASALSAPRAHVIGLGCGGGLKDSQLLARLKASAKEVFYTPLDVSSAMVLVARQQALAVVEDAHCFPVVCDLGSASDLPVALAGQAVPGATRLFTFFGMLPNFEPSLILSRLADLVRPEDRLLLSANLAPGPDYAEGVRAVLPLYDNPLTRDWLLTFLFDLGVEPEDGRLRFEVEEDAGGLGLKRIAAIFRFDRPRELQADSERVKFPAGDSLRVFFSYRHTPALVRALLAPHGLDVAGQWIAPSAQEGIFLVRRG